MEEFVPIVANFGIRVLGVLGILFLTWLVAKAVKNLVGRRLKKANFDESLTPFLQNVAYWLILLMGTLSSLSIFGVQTTSFAAVLGAAGLAIGLAFQGSLSNVAAGVMILVFRPFKVGQVIKVAGQTGKIHAIGLFATDMDTPQNVRVIIPNSAVFGSTIENFGFHDTRRADVNVGTDYGADLKHTREVLESLIEAVSNKLYDGAHAVVMTDLGASSIDWQLRVWARADDYWGVLEETRHLVKTKLDEAGIGIPYPQMDVHLDKVN